MARTSKVKNHSSWGRLLETMDRLREECPWDKKQTIHSLRNLTMEEVHELADAIEDEDWEGIQEELGDVLLHLVFYARIAREKGKFNIEEAIDSLVEKLVRRHPHIYGDEDVNNDEEVKSNWEKIKKEEKAGKKTLDGVPRSLPSVIQALRLQEKAASVGFDWNKANQVIEKVKEEVDELENAQNPDHRREEFGDLLFALINYARKSDIDPELALREANKKFKNRFQSMEEEFEAQGLKIHDLDLEEMEKMWQYVKKKN